MKEIYDQQRGLGIDRKTAMRRARGMAGLEDMVERRKDRKEGSGPIADSLAQVGGGGRSMMGEHAATYGSEEADKFASADREKHGRGAEGQP